MSFLREIQLYKGDKYSLPHRDILRLKWYLQHIRKCYHGKCLGCSSVTGAPVSLMNVLQGKLRSNIWRDNWTQSAYFWHFVFIVKIKARCLFLRISSAIASFPFSVSYSTQMTSSAAIFKVLQQMLGFGSFNESCRDCIAQLRFLLCSSTNRAEMCLLGWLTFKKKKRKRGLQRSGSCKNSKLAKNKYGHLEHFLLL